MRMSHAILAALALTACTTEPPGPLQMGDPEVGHQVAKDLCSDCHAVERTGDSRNPAAPPLRTVLAGYPPEWLATDLHDGRTIALRKMPTFHFGEGHEYDLVAYLIQIQDVPAPRPNLGPQGQP
ncbi:MAG: hypothetical protein R3C46_12960 [Hyphomonadaceae bacterium]